MDSTETMQGGRMARIRKGKNPGPVAVRRTVKKRTPGADTGVANEKPHPVQRVTEFPKSPAADDVVSDRIIFEIGDSRFAIQWTADIERLMLILNLAKLSGWQRVGTCSPPLAHRGLRWRRTKTSAKHKASRRARPARPENTK